MKYPACVLVIAAFASSQAAAKSADSLAFARRDVAGAAAVAVTYGAITSIYRTVEHNRAVGGVANSFHLQGRAIDIIRRPGVTHAMIANALNRAGYTMVESLDEGDHSHFAFGSPAPTSHQIAASPPPPAPEPPKHPRILADEHGTLRIDLPAPRLTQR